MNILKKIQARFAGGGESTSDLVTGEDLAGIINGMAERVDILETELDKVRKSAEATRRKVYRDGNGVADDPGEAVAQPTPGNWWDNLKPGDPPPQGY